MEAFEGNDFVGEMVRVFWESENDWMQGVIDEYDSEKGYHVQYFEDFDADNEWVRKQDILKF